MMIGSAMRSEPGAVATGSPILRIPTPFRLYEMSMYYRTRRYSHEPVVGIPPENRSMPQTTSFDSIRRHTDRLDRARRLHLGGLDKNFRRSYSFHPRSSAPTIRPYS